MEPKTKLAIGLAIAALVALPLPTAALGDPDGGTATLTQATQCYGSKAVTVLEDPAIDPTVYACVTIEGTCAREKANADDNDIRITHGANFKLSWYASSTRYTITCQGEWHADLYHYGGAGVRQVITQTPHTSTSGIGTVIPDDTTITTPNACVYVGQVTGCETSSNGDWTYLVTRKARPVGPLNVAIEITVSNTAIATTIGSHDTYDFDNDIAVIDGEIEIPSLPILSDKE